MISACTPPSPSPSVLDAAASPSRLTRRLERSNSCTASTASTISQDAEARDARVADLPPWGDTFERKAPSATTGLPKHLWQADCDALTCGMMTCGKEFHRFFRRHHCRMCGRVVCAECSGARRRETGSEKAREVRVCDACATPDLYTMSRTIAPSTPPRSGAMRALKNVLRRCSETSLPAPRARSDAGGRPSDGADVAHGASTEVATCSVVAPGGEQDHVLQALRAQYSTTWWYYEGLLLHEPAALDLLLRCAADQVRSREM